MSAEKTLNLFLICFVLTTGMPAFTLAEEITAKVESYGETQAINAGNKICPVSGDKINQDMEPVTYEYKGKIYNFCCPMCIDEFKKDPEKYIKNVDTELSGPELK